MVLAGQKKAQMMEGNKAAFEKGELPPLEPGAMSYMISKAAYLTDLGCRSAEITGNAESTIQRCSTSRRVYRSRGQMVRRIRCSGYVGPFM